MPLLAELVVTYGSMLSASTPWAIVSVPLGSFAAAFSAGLAASAGLGAAGAVVAAGWAAGAAGLGASVGFASTFAAGLGASVGLGAGAAVGAGAGACWQAVARPPSAPRPASALSRTNARRLMRPRMSSLLLSFGWSSLHYQRCLGGCWWRMAVPTHPD